jgi:hypothetical protein
MSTATDILGKVGEKVGSEIKNIKDNYATKVSLGNVSSTIDFSPYATVVSLGVVDQKIENLDLSPYSTKASLAAYANGSSTFSNLKASRAEVDELIVRGDTTIVNTQTVEVSDNMIEVNLAADGNITTNTGGIAVNRGLQAGSYVQDTDIATSLTAAKSQSIEGGEYVITELGTSYKPTAQLPGSEFIKNFIPGSDFSLTQVYNAPSSVDYNLGPSNIPSWTDYRFAPTGAFSNYTGDSYYAGRYYSADYAIEPWVFDASVYRFSHSSEDGSTFDNMTDATRYWPKYLKRGSSMTAVSEHVTYKISFKKFDGETAGTIYYKRMDDATGAGGEYYKPSTGGDYDGWWSFRYYDDSSNDYFTGNSSMFTSENSLVPVNFADQKTYISSFGSGDSKEPAGAGTPTGTSADWKQQTKFYTHSNPVEFPFGGSVTSYRSDGLSLSGYTAEMEHVAGISKNTDLYHISNELYLRQRDPNSGDQDNSVIAAVSGSKGSLTYTAAEAGWDITPSYNSSNNVTSLTLEWTGAKPAEGVVSGPADTTGNLTENAGTPKSYRIETAVYNGLIQSRVKTAWKERDGGAGNQLNMGYATIATYTEAGAVLPDAELVWNQDLDAWSFSKDGSGSKIFYSNVFPTASDLPSASTYHGMFAHVHDTGRGYFAHGGVWKELFDTSAGQTVTGNIDVSAGSALKVADSSGIKINNIDLGNYASFESALVIAVNGPPSYIAGAGVSSETIVIEANDSSLNPAVHINRFQFVKDGKLHVYDGTASSSSAMWTVSHDYATPYRKYIDESYQLNTDLSDSGITEIYGGFESVLAWGRDVPRYFYISADNSLVTEAEKTSGGNDMSSFTGPVLTIDPFRLLWSDFEPAANEQHSPFDA